MMIMIIDSAPEPSMRSAAAVRKPVSQAKIVVELIRHITIFVNDNGVDIKENEKSPRSTKMYIIRS
jgi:hypothetical protein